MTNNLELEAVAAAVDPQRIIKEMLSMVAVDVPDSHAVLLTDRDAPQHGVMLVNGEKATLVSIDHITAACAEYTAVTGEDIEPDEVFHTLNWHCE